MVENNIFKEKQAPSRIPPKLARCIILDSRFSSQQRLKFDLGKSALFKEIEISPEINSGIETVRNGSADVCVIGPSMSLQAATRFLVTTRHLPSRKCALVALSNKPGSAMALKMSGADEVMDGSYSQVKLSKSVVKAVVMVKPNSSWVGYLEVLEREEKEVELKERSEPSSAQLFGAILERSAPLLARIATGVTKGFYGKDEDGKLSVLTKTALSRVVEILLDTRSQCDDQLRIFLLETLEQWVLDILELGEGMAKLRLKNRLLKGS